MVGMVRSTPFQLAALLAVVPVSIWALIHAFIDTHAFFMAQQFIHASPLESRRNSLHSSHPHYHRLQQDDIPLPGWTTLGCYT